MFYFVIGIMSTHIECYLWGGVEFEMKINHIMVDLCSFSPPPPPLHTTLALTLFNHAHQPCPWAPPLNWGMWAWLPPSQLPQKRGCSPSCPSPFQRDVGSLVSLDGWSREGGRRKGPMELDAPVVSCETWATTLVVAHFCYPLPISLI